MNRMNNAVGAACIVALLAAVQASACGGSLLRAGFGVNIPVVKVEHAANIVIFTPTKHDVFFDDAKVAARLDKTGHKVTVVHQTAETGAGDTPAYDIVLARGDDFESARQTMGSQVANSVFVPVHEGFAKSNDAALTLSENAQLQQILKVLKLALDTVRPDHPTA
jgi:hypothetical protein